MGASGFSSPRSRRQAWTAAAGQALAVPRATGSAAENAPCCVLEGDAFRIDDEETDALELPGFDRRLSHCRRTASVTRSGAGGTETDREARIAMTQGASA